MRRARLQRDLRVFLPSGPTRSDGDPAARARHLEGVVRERIEAQIPQLEVGYRLGRRRYERRPGPEEFSALEIAKAELRTARAALRRGLDDAARLVEKPGRRRIKR